MRKYYLFAAAGAAVIMCGCSSKPITGHKTVIPAPLDDPSPTVAPAVSTAPGATEWEAPQTPKTAGKTAAVSEFEPLTGAVPSGGIESTGKSGKKGKKSSGVTAKGGVYVVQSGDTPERIARKNGVRLSALMAANNLDQQSARRLQIGQKLTIPGKDAKYIAPAKKQKKSASAVKESSAAVDASGKYTVQPGDSPERIARKHRVRLSELLKANNLDQQSARRLQIGQKLVIPGKAVAQEVKPAVTVVENPPVVTETGAVTDNGAATDAGAAVVVDTPAAPAAVETTDAGADDANIKVVDITEDITLDALAAKLNVPASVIKEKNSDRTEFKKGDLVIVPNK